MNDYFVGFHHGTNDRFRLRRRSFDTHYHFIGGTGKGKTTLIHTIAHQLMLDPVQKPCIIVIDKMGNLSTDLLLWMASDYCPPHVRDRLVYIEPANENIVIPFNPLLYRTPAEGYYKVSRGMEIILRGWASESLDEKPRLARWMWNAFWSVAQLGLTIADCIHFIMPGSRHHQGLIKLLPPQLAAEWQEIHRSQSGEESKMLEAVRNRLKPYFDSPPLNNMFNSAESKLDVLRFMKEGRIVLLNLAPYGRLPEQNANAIGGLAINEVMAAARSLEFDRYPTYLILDEFQNYVGPDIESAIPEVRQLDIKLLLSHQSFSQLKQGDCDLSSIIFQCQSRAIFGLQGLDAEILAQELASYNYDPYRIKDEIYSHRQRLTGHKIIDLQSSSYTQQQAENWTKNFGQNWSANQSTNRKVGGYDLGTMTQGSNRGGTMSEGQGGSATSGTTHGSHQSLMPVYEDVEELARRTYFTFEECRNLWAKDIRTLPRGETFLSLVDDKKTYHIDVHRSAPGPLAWDRPKIRKYLPQLLDRMQALKELNYQSEFFVKPYEVERQATERLDRLLRPVITVQSPPPSGGVFT